MIEHIPTVAYCLTSINLSWGDVMWAVERGWWGWREIKDFAISRLNDAGLPTFSVETQIFYLEEVDKHEIVGLGQEAANLMPSPHSMRRWEFLLLKWTYDKRDRLDNVFGCAEEIFAEFDYPDRMRSFIPFLPPADGWQPLLHSAEENKRRLLRNWENYLQQPIPDFDK